MSDSEQDITSNVLWTNMFSQIQKSMAETANLLTEIRAERASNSRRSEDSPTPASEEAQPPASEEAQAPALEEANTSQHCETDIEQNQNEDLISLFGGDDFDTDNDDFLQAIDESLRPSDSYGPKIKEKVAKIVNEKFSSDIGIEKRKEYTA